jgi:hypothetical protein
MANTVSVMMTPPMSSAMPMPMTVTIGTEALRSAWPTSTLPSARPFACAVRM